jgi:hypothetical protein
MQLAVTGLVVLGGMTFSLAIGVLVEELIFAKLFPLLFVRPAAAVKPATRH